MASPTTTPSSSLIFLVLLAHAAPLAVAMLDPVDFLSLQAIRKSLHDTPGSNFFASWDFTSDPCGFPGVLCDSSSSSRVVSLSLGDPRASAPGLTGRLDPALGNLSSLAELAVVPGRIFGRIPQSLYRLRNLRFLAVGHNFLSGEIPADLGLLRNLRTLDLSYNRLTGLVPRAVGSLPSLSNLVLCHNQLSGPVPPFLSRTLTRIDLTHNELSGPVPPTYLPLSLQYLSLSWNRLSGPVDRLLYRLGRLNYLDLSMNQFTGPIPGQVFGYPIKTLQLQRNAFSGLVRPARWVVIPTVDLSYNRLSGEIPPEFSTVRSLYLNSNRFTGQVPGSFVDRLLGSSIRVLYLQHNFLTGIEINPAAEIPATSSLCLQYNCMVPPVQSPCPSTAGTQKSRPTWQCREWRRRRG
ncbi:LRR receptor-like serine/threonine-protein kinase ER2 [Syzygium oleosum]|uniref:LRR receptor-like serine/threonine-protein kinase ER2 n=1 Tax=Syzygium oleosum TaxID=219896 RepID=UPI0011D29C24|nr:LRR receptor-like serine/threonine-protein kinase ER2 [Syzygium oleosum]